MTLRVLLLLLTPVAGPSLPGRLSSYNDELAHGNYTLHVLETGSLPVQVEAIDARAALERGAYENYQPPLFYIIHAGLCRLVGCRDLSGIILLGRGLNAVLGLGLIALFVALGRSLWNARIVAAGTVLLALSGVFVRFTTVSGNEALFWLLAGGMIWSAVFLARQPDSVPFWMLFALLAILGLYTKLTALLLLPLPLAALWRARHVPRAWWLFVISGLLVIAATIPLWLRNYHQFGSLLPLDAGFGDPAWRIPGFSFLVFAARSLVFPWWEFWRGGVGLLFMLPALLLFLDGAVRRGGWRIVCASPVLSAALLIAAASFLWLNCRYTQAEARYLFSAWPALGAMFGGEPAADRRLWLLALVLVLPFGLMLLPAGV